jgi:hypothetical protein
MTGQCTVAFCPRPTERESGDYFLCERHWRLRKKELGWTRSQLMAHREKLGLKPKNAPGTGLGGKVTSPSRGRIDD